MGISREGGLGRLTNTRLGLGARVFQTSSLRFGLICGEARS